MTVDGNAVGIAQVGLPRLSDRSSCLRLRGKLRDAQRGEQVRHY